MINLKNFFLPRLQAVKSPSRTKNIKFLRQVGNIEREQSRNLSHIVLGAGVLKVMPEKRSMQFWAEINRGFVLSVYGRFSSAYGMILFCTLVVFYLYNKLAKTIKKAGARRKVEARKIGAYSFFLAFGLSVTPCSRCLLLVVYCTTSNARLLSWY